MSVYRKTATVEATQWHALGDHPSVKTLPSNHPAWNCAEQAVRLGWIETLEGGFVVHIGDWICTGVKGEHWAIKPDIFEASYELVTP